MIGRRNFHDMIPPREHFFRSDLWPILLGCLIGSTVLLFVRPPSDDLLTVVAAIFTF
jgi:hypothetical protein